MIFFMKGSGGVSPDSSYAQARIWKFAADAACGPRGE